MCHFWSLLSSHHPSVRTDVTCFHHSFVPFSVLCMINSTGGSIRFTVVTNFASDVASKSAPALMTCSCAHLLSQTSHSSQRGLSCGRSPPWLWSAVFLSTSSNTWSGSSPPQVTPNSHPDSSPDCSRLVGASLSVYLQDLWSQMKVDLRSSSSANDWRVLVAQIKLKNSALRRPQTRDLIPFVGQRSHFFCCIDI